MLPGSSGLAGSVAKRENVPPTTDTPKNCLPFYGNQIPLLKSIIASYRAVPRYPLFATLVMLAAYNGHRDIVRYLRAAGAAK